MRSPNDSTGNRTRDLLDCSAVPQPTAPPRTVRFFCQANFMVFIKSCTTQFLQSRNNIDQIRQKSRDALIAPSPGTPCNILLQSSYKFSFDCVPTICHPRLRWRNKTYSYWGDPSVPLFCPGVVADNITCVSTIIQSYLTAYIITCTSTVIH
jgi:hypothetical protein